MVSVFILCFPTLHHCSHTCIPYHHPKIYVQPPKLILLPPAWKQRKLYKNSEFLISPRLPCSPATSEQLGGRRGQEVTRRWHQVSWAERSSLTLSSLFPCLVRGAGAPTEWYWLRGSKAKPSWEFLASGKWEEKKMWILPTNSLSSAGAKAAPASEH